jgi:protein O-GlcNAc transferase
MSPAVKTASKDALPGALGIAARGLTPMQPICIGGHYNPSFSINWRGAMTQATIDQAMQLALQHHQAGRLAAAEKIYRQVLIHEPGHAYARHLLGVIAAQVGRSDAAVELIQSAIAANPAVADFHYNLGNALRDKGLFEEAIAAYRQALQLRPDMAEATNNLGNALSETGRLDEAIVAFHQALRLRPDLAEAHNNLGNALRKKGQLDQAIAAYRQAIRVKPDFADAYNNLGVALRDREQLDEGITAYRQALRLKPDFAGAYGNLGVALRDKGLLDEAIAACRDALRIKPEYAVGHSNLGHALRDKGLPDEAIAAYRQALRLMPDNAEVHHNLGNALRDKGLPDEAIAAFRDAVRLKPDFAVAHKSLGNILKDLGQMEQAIASYQRAMNLSPDDAGIHSNMVYALGFDPNYTSAAILQEAARWDDLHGKPLRSSIKPQTNDRDPNRRLHIGYVSPDFRSHCLSLFMVPLFSSHHRERFEFYGYSSAIRPDAVTQRIQQHFDVWRSVFDRSDSQLADIIRADGIDILVDLTMHMPRGRPLLFARKPAPIQVAWLAYPGTTGLSAIDYRLTDPYLDPPGQNDSDYSEISVRLPDTFWCYDPLCGEPAVNRMPAFDNGHVTFGCLNNYCKVNEQVLALWAKVLAELRDSQLLILTPEGHARQCTLDTLASFNIDRRRIQFVPFRPRLQYLQTYHRIDIGLDTFPYNGHTTSLDSYWMGVPVVTLMGQTVVGRAGWCHLSNLGLQELAAQTSEQFIEIAIKLAKDLPRLSQLRSTLRERLQKSPLMDAPRFAQNMEAAYRHMWKSWCGSQAQSHGA